MKTAFLTARVSFVICLLGSFVVSGNTWASHIPVLPGHIDGITVTATSTHSTRQIGDIVNGDGMITTGADAGKHTTEPLDMWDTNANRPVQYVNFDMHGNYNLGTVHVWNWHTIKAAKDVEILVADTYMGHGSGGQQNHALMTSLGDFVFPQTVSNPDPGFAIDLSGFGAAADVAHVRFVITTNWVDKHPFLDPDPPGGGAGPWNTIPNPDYVLGGGGWLLDNVTDPLLKIHNNSRTGLAEVQFFPIPEPSTALLAMLGFVAVGFWQRRRPRTN